MSRSRELIATSAEIDAVRIMTIHATKGLEFPLVYAPFLWEPGWIPEGNRPVYFHDGDHGDVRAIDVGLEGGADDGDAVGVRQRDELEISVREVPGADAWVVADVVGALPGKEVADQLAAAAWNDPAPRFRIGLERLPLERVDLIADEAGDSHRGETSMDLWDPSVAA